MSARLLSRATTRSSAILMTAVLTAALLPVIALAADYDDGHGRLWRGPAATTGLSWDQVATICPTDGQTPGDGTVAGRNLTGWVWATREQVTEMMSYWVPEILTTPSIDGPAYVLVGIGFTDTLGPTWKVHIETFSGQSVTGLTATRNPDDSANTAGAFAQWPFFDGGFWVNGSRPTNTGNAQTGVWLWKSLTPPVVGDVDGDGDVDLSDLATLLANFGQTSGAARTDGDMDADQDVDLTDLSIVLSNFGI